MPPTQNAAIQLIGVFTCKVFTPNPLGSRWRPPTARPPPAAHRSGGSRSLSRPRRPRSASQPGTHAGPPPSSPRRTKAGPERQRDQQRPAPRQPGASTSTSYRLPGPRATNKAAPPPTAPASKGTSTIAHRGPPTTTHRAMAHRPVPHRPAHRRRNRPNSAAGPANTSATGSATTASPSDHPAPTGGSAAPSTATPSPAGSTTGQPSNRSATAPDTPPPGSTNSSASTSSPCPNHHRGRRPPRTR